MSDHADRAAAGHSGDTVEPCRPRWQGLFLEPDLPPGEEEDETD